MDITSVVSLIVSSIAILISILGVLYSRQRTKIMGKQLEQQREQLEKRQRFERISKTILQAVRTIKENAKLKEFYAFPMADMSSEVLGFIHDNELETCELNIKPRELTVSFSSREDYIAKDFRNVKKIVDVTKKEIDNVTGCIFYFDCDPSIFSDTWIELGDALYTINQLYYAYGQLENYKDDIALFNSTILDDLEQNIDSILRVLLESLVSEHKISFSSTDKSKQILRKLQNEMTDLESINLLLKELSVDLCDKRLIPTQREIFSKS